MSWTSAVVGALVVAFVVFIVMRGELPQYLATLFPKQAAPSSSGSSGSSGGLGSLGSLGGSSGGIQGSSPLSTIYGG